MGRKFIDGFASWEFQGYGKNYSLTELNALSTIERLSIYSDNLKNLEVVLAELKNEKLLKASHLYFPDSEIKLDTAQTEKEIIALIYKHIESSDKNESVFWIEGETVKHTHEHEIAQTGIISILYELWSDLISITTYDDFWMPIEMFSDYWSKPKEEFINVDSAIINSGRIQKALQSIKAKGNFKKIYPDEYEIRDDYGVVQKGFRMYYNNSAKEMIKASHLNSKMDYFFISENE